jgi:hypothetical protein
LAKDWSMTTISEKLKCSFLVLDSVWLPKYLKFRQIFEDCWVNLERTCHAPTCTALNGPLHAGCHDVGSDARMRAGNVLQRVACNAQKVYLDENTPDCELEWPISSRLPHEVGVT